MKMAHILMLVCICMTFNTVEGVTRKFYIAAVEDYWNYQPGTPNSTLFKKAMYKEFTDDTFTVEKQKPEWHGLIGPPLYGEEGDMVEVLFFNNATITYSMHPHGLLYKKEHEGALYNDGIHGNNTVHTSDIVDPGLKHVYRWKVTSIASPRDGDPTCFGYTYHSHVTTPKDVNSGLLGFVFACKKGTLQNLYRHYFLFVMRFDEDESWYFEENKRNNPTVNLHRPRFPAINGYTSGTLPGLDACAGETITWHMAGLGTFVDTHALSLSGHTFLYYNTRKSIIRLSTGQSATATTKAVSPGKWLLSCNVNRFRENMYAYFNVDACGKKIIPIQKVKKIRRHYIAAEEIMWNYGPSGVNGMTGEALDAPGSDSEKVFAKEKSAIAGVFKKVVFRAYDDYHFKTKRIQKDRPKHMGIIGPVIRAEVGDMLEIVFKNMARRNFSLHAEGVMFSKRSEGLLGSSGEREAGDEVAPGQTYTYFWKVPHEMAPTEKDPQCLSRIYMSGVSCYEDSNSGLIGPLLICKPGSLDRHGKQKNIDREFILMMLVFDEKKSWYYDDNIKRAGKDAKAFAKLPSINGLMYGNIKGMNMCIRDTVAWHVMNVGDVDLHSMYFHGNGFRLLGTHHVSTGLQPGARQTMIMRPDSPGEWELGCENFVHFAGGERAVYRVDRCGRQPRDRDFKAKKRTFYIQAEEIDWDYLPTGKNMIFDTELPEKVEFSSYRKVVYRQYTDGTFSIPVSRLGEEYLGMLGPVIRVEQGDILRVIFRNKAQRPFSFHPIGVVYRQRRRSDRFKDLKDPDQPSVLPGKTFTYEWDVRKSAGPGNSDDNCTSSIYYSDINTPKDISTGLIGPLVICKKGILDKQGQRKDVNKDFALLFSIFKEEKSWLAERNLAACKAKSEQAECKFIEATSINGFIYGNIPVPTMPQYTYVDWYISTMGDINDYHPVHFHGNDFYIYDGQNHVTDVAPMLPGRFHTVRMYTLNGGKWLFHCHVNNHIERGMEGMYLVEE